MARLETHGHAQNRSAIGRDSCASRVDAIATVMSRQVRVSRPRPIPATFDEIGAKVNSLRRIVKLKINEFNGVFEVVPKSIEVIFG